MYKQLVPFLKLLSGIMPILWKRRRDGDKFIHTHEAHVINNRAKDVRNTQGTVTLVCVCETDLFKIRPTTNAHRRLNFLHTRTYIYEYWEVM
jgi:hypothetical protein